MPERYETWHPRVWDNASRALGFTLIVWQAARPVQSRDLLTVGLLLLLAPGVRRQVLRRLVGDLSSVEEKLKELDDDP